MVKLLIYLIISYGTKYKQQLAGLSNMYLEELGYLW